jgi:FMN phosphatase YigB (HAD superfamily)
MPIPLQITTLLFDLDGTLTYQLPSSLDSLFTLLDEYDIPLMATAHRETLQFVYRYWANSEEVADDLQMYGEFTQEFWVHYLKRKLWAAGLPEDQALDLAPKLLPILDERHQPVKMVLDDVKPTLKKLRTQGYTMGLVTNRSEPVKKELEEFGFIPFFDFFFAAGEINAWKPDPAIFEHAIFLAGSNPEETTYIGDNYYTDVVGARNAGLYPILYDPRNTFPDADCQVINWISDLCTHM